jgi:hypothetical protein
MMNDDPSLHEWGRVPEGLRNEWQCSRCLFRRISKDRPDPADRLAYGTKVGGMSCDELIVRYVQLS